MINVQNFFRQPVKNDIETHQNITKIITAQGDFFTTSCYLITTFFKKAISWL